ncbi:MAG: patatin-like phospholipase family protein [Spirosomataceae bacterium]
MKIGLALSGGGAKGIAHLGVIKALSELGIKPDAIAGTSAGSIVGSMTAAGYSPEFILDIILSTSILRNLKPAFNRFGLFKIESAQAIFAKYMPHDSFEGLKLPLTITATDIEKGEVVYFDNGELIKPILASCCLPGIFEPIRYQDRLLIDGGVLNNIPIEPLESTCDFIIGVNVMPIGEGMPINSMKDVLSKSLHIAIRNNSIQKLKKCNLAIEPPELYKFDGFNVTKAKELYKIGYEYTMKTAEGKLAQIL